MKCLLMFFPVLALLPVLALGETFDEWKVTQRDQDKDRLPIAWRAHITVPDTNATPAGSYLLGYIYEQVAEDRIEQRAVYGLLADLAAAQSNQDYLATLPEQHPRGIEAPAIVLTDTNGAAYRYITSQGSLIGGLLDHASPRPSKAVIDAADAAARASHHEEALRKMASDTGDTNAMTSIQRDGHKVLKSLKASVGLPPRASDIRLQRFLLEQSLTNNATAALRQQWATYLIQTRTALDLQEWVKPEPVE